MHKTKSTIEQARRELARLGHIDCRSQFGGYSLSVDKVVFALISEGELYLRACEETKQYLVERDMKPLLFDKKGIPVVLEYYRVDDTLWQQQEQLIALSELCLQGAREQRVKSSQENRLKDLPNLSTRLELLLRRAGIHSVEMLKNYGAKTCWLKMHASNKNLGINILFALEGAITGRHCSVLPANVKTDLVEWHRTAVGDKESFNN